MGVGIIICLYFTNCCVFMKQLRSQWQEQLITNILLSCHCHTPENVLGQTHPWLMMQQKAMFPGVSKNLSSRWRGGTRSDGAIFCVGSHTKL